MNTDEVKERVAEFARIRSDAGEDPVAQVEAALFVEEVFGIQLTDEDMTSQKLGTHQALEQLVIERLGVNS